MHYLFNFQVRLEHILERIALISDAASTEKPSAVTSSLFIGGALAARSVYTLQYLGITNILCLCTNEIGQSETQYPDLFEYKNFSVSHIYLYFLPSLILCLICWVYFIWESVELFLDACLYFPSLIIHAVSFRVIHVNFSLEPYAHPHFSL